MTYARHTRVSVDKSRFEIEQTLKRYGATKFSYGSDEDRGLAAIMFFAHDRHVRFVVTLPSIEDPRFRKCRGQASKQNAVEQLERSRWRALLLCVKAKLEAVESEIESFEEAFLAHVVVPDGKTVAEWLKPQLQIAYDTGQMPQSLLALPAPEDD